MRLPFQIFPLMIAFIMPFVVPAGEPVVAAAVSPRAALPSMRMWCPPGWAQSTAPGTAAAFLAPAFPEDTHLFDQNVNLVVRAVEEGSNLESYSRRAVEEILSAVPLAALIETGPAVLGGLPATRAVFTGRLGDLPMKWLQVWTLQDGKSYVFTYSALQSDYERPLADAMKLIDSFEFTQRSQ